MSRTSGSGQKRKSARQPNHLYERLLTRSKPALTILVLSAFRPTLLKIDRHQGKTELLANINNDFTGNDSAFDGGICLLDRLQAKMAWVEAGYDLSRLY